MNTFQAPADNLGALSAPTAAKVIGAAADIAIVLDANGTILDVSASSDGLVGRNWHAWIGLPWIDTVAEDSRSKVTKLLSSDPEHAGAQRQINQMLGDGEELLVLYSSVILNDDGNRVAIGKDLSSLTRLQQRLVNVQQSMERDYARLRQFETRYRLLFQTTGEAILLANASTGKIIEANPAVCELLEVTERRLVGSSIGRWFGDTDRQSVEDAVGAVRLSGNPMNLRLASTEQTLDVHLSLFKSDNASHLLIRLEDPYAGNSERTHSEQVERLMALVESAPDALVVTDDRGSVLTANTEFLDLTQLASVEQAAGQSLAKWLGMGGIDYQVIMASLREHGSVRLYITQMRGEFGSITDVEVSAAIVRSADIDCVGFSIRNISRRVAANDESAGTSPRSVDQLTQLVGRVPLKELVRESTELIEQLCIQAALKLTGNNRASAAEMLGLSRQSLYVKLRRYSLEDDSESADRNEPAA